MSTTTNISKEYRNDDMDDDDHKSLETSSTVSIATAEEEQQRMLLFQQTVSTSRNRCVSCCIVILALFAMACGIYSTLSCEWFAWTPLGESNAWGVFAIDSTANQAESVGLFRYLFVPEDDDDEENDKGSASLLPTSDRNRIQATFSSCELYADAQSNDWLLISRKTDPWMFTAQLCWVLATILAALSTIVALPQCFLSCFSCCCDTSSSCCCCCYKALSHWASSNGRASCFASCGWLLASGLQAASCLAATALCGGFDFWECPWLQGAHASAGAAWFYLLCWLLSVCGYRGAGAGAGADAGADRSLVVQGDSSTTADNKDLVSAVNHHHHYYHHHHHNRHRSGRREHEGQEEDEDEVVEDLEGGNRGRHHHSPPRDILDFHVSSSSMSSEHQEDCSTNTKKVMTAEELLGTNDPIIHRAVGQRAEAIREFAVAQPMMEDDDSEEEEDKDENDDANWIDDGEGASTATPKAQNATTSQMEP